MASKVKGSFLAPERSCQIKQRGMSMLEVVVSMLIIGLGLAMGISMIQTSNRFGNNAEFTHSALEQAQAIIDKIRANQVAAESYEYMGGAALSANYDTMYAAVANEATYISGINGLTRQCTTGISTTDCQVPGDTAKADMQAWSRNIRALLPGGRGLISMNGRNLEVIVMWSNTAETDTNLNPVAQGIRVNFTL